MKACSLMLIALCAIPLDAGAQQSRMQELGNALEQAAEARAAAKATARFDDTFRKYSKRYFGPGFDWTYFKAQAMAESGLDPAAVSHVGARGLMQLMPSTYRGIQTSLPELGSIDDPEWNIAAGIMHNRYLWRFWSRDVPEPERLNFMFSSFNAGQGTIRRATATARAENLDHAQWSSIEVVAPKVPRWRYRETLGYLRRIESYYGLMRPRR